MTGRGVRCKVCRTYDGALLNNNDYGVFFTSEQIDYYLQKKAKLEAHGLYGNGDELLLGNVMMSRN